MRRVREKLTNELISKKFVNQFNLVNYAISRAEDLIKSGRVMSNEEGTENPALVALEDIEKGKDKFDEVAIENVQTIEEVKESEETAAE